MQVDSHQLRIEFTQVDAAVVVLLFLDGILQLEDSELVWEVFSYAVEFNNIVLFIFIETK